MSEIKINSKIKHLPLLALRGLAIFPGMLMTFDVERPASLAALNNAMAADQLIFMAAQKDLRADMPEQSDIWHIGTVCRIRQMLRQPRSKICRVMVEGLYRAEVLSMSTDPECYTAQISPYPDAEERISEVKKEAILRNCLSLFEEYIQLSPDMVPEQIINVRANPNIPYVSNYIAQYTAFNLPDKQMLLEELRPCKRLEKLSKILSREIHILSMERELSEATQQQMNQNQREYYLREEMKIIQSELGEDGLDDIAEYRNKIEALKADDEVKEKLVKEVNRLAKQPFGSSEASVLRNYLDVCLEIPWDHKTEETVDIAKARKILDDEHFGLEKVKERILEYLAVKQLAPEVKGGLICLVGPPGTGKTSIAMSVAKATNRKLVRISLCGVHDEAEIRGHRKTYIGAMPCRIISGLIQAKSSNPLMVLDEVDKLCSDYKGDPSAALLEALDPEQNNSFRDNFLELPMDLSSVFFITTANSLDTIPRPLLDRMEVIELSSYTDEEKLQIAKRHLLPKQRKKHGLRANQLKLEDNAIREIIDSYTRESGVRKLERQIAAVCRKTASGIAEEKFKSLNLKAGKLEEVLGPARFKPDQRRVKGEVGLVRGLAYTSVGGEVLDVEVAVTEGTGKLELTGNLGDVMKESAKAALTYIRSRATQLGISSQFYKECDIHIHFPEGAVPKDGPSAGITVCVALISALTARPVRADIAMTGEISLRGRVMAIGGLREKTMAALRAGVRTVLIPADNEADLAEIDQTVRQALNFIPTDHVDKILDIVFETESSELGLCPPPAASSERCGVRQ